MLFLAPLPITIISNYAPKLSTLLLCTYFAWAVCGVYIAYELVSVPMHSARELLLTKALWSGGLAPVGGSYPT